MLQSVLLLIAFVLIILFWAVCEVAFLGLRKSDIEAMEKGSFADKRRAGKIKYILNEINYFLFSVHTAVLLTWMFFGALIFLMPVYTAAAFGFIAAGAILALTLAAVVKTKTRAGSTASAHKFILPLLSLALFILSPLLRLITILINFILKRLGVDLTKETGISEDDIRSMVNKSGEKGSIDAHEQEMINNIFEFDDKSAEDIATRRRDIAAIDVDSSREEIISIIMESGYSRYPVYEESIDNIIGILYIKDILNHILTVKDLQYINPRDFMHEPFVVPSSKKIDDLFEEMKRKKVHIAIVADEYGGCVGLVTVEDLLEEIVGQIYDEYDEVEIPDIEKIGNGKYMLQGTAKLDDVAETLKISFPDEYSEEYDTISGFLFHLLDRIPNDGEKPNVVYGGFSFQVYEMREKRIHSIFVEEIQAEE